MQVVHTASLRPGDLDAVRDLLQVCFDDLTEADVEHALGGLHAMVWDGDELVLPAGAALDLSGELACDGRDGHVW